MDLISNMSDESTMTMGGPASIREKKIERVDESLDVKLNRYLMKWMVVIIFYQVSFVFSIIGWALPAIPALKIAIGFWIMLPQFKGEFYLYHFLEEYIYKVERILLGWRCNMCSAMVTFCSTLHLGALKFAVSFISEKCVMNSLENCKQALEILEDEVQCRTLNNGKPVTKRQEMSDFVDFRSKFNGDDAKSDRR